MIRWSWPRVRLVMRIAGIFGLELWVFAHVWKGWERDLRRKWKRWLAS